MACVRMESSGREPVAPLARGSMNYALRAYEIRLRRMNSMAAPWMNYRCAV